MIITFRKILYLYLLLFFFSCNYFPKNELDRNNKDLLIDKRDGKKYKTTQIGESTWMIENIAYKPKDGNCWAYDNNNENIEVYGLLYDWQTAQKVCPDGWHLPNEKEWNNLIDNLKKENKLFQEIENSGKYPDSCLCFNSKFFSTPGGYRHSEGWFNLLGDVGFWWSSTVIHSDGSISPLFPTYVCNNKIIYSLNENEGLSVRCVKNY